MSAHSKPNNDFSRTKYLTDSIMNATFQKNCFLSVHPGYLLIGICEFKNGQSYYSAWFSLDVCQLINFKELINSVAKHLVQPEKNDKCEYRLLSDGKQMTSIKSCFVVTEVDVNNTETFIIEFTLSTFLDFLICFDNLCLWSTCPDEETINIRLKFLKHLVDTDQDFPEADSKDSVEVVEKILGEEKHPGNVFYQKSKIYAQEGLVKCLFQVKLFIVSLTNKRG